MAWNRVAIVGIGLIRFGELFDKSYEAMMQEAFINAVNSVDKGFDPKDIQAAWLGTCAPMLFSSDTLGGAMLVGNLGLAGIPSTHIENGCPTGSDAFRNACLGVASGVYDVALVVGVEKMSDKSSEEGMIGRSLQRHPIINRAETAIAMFAGQATRHMHEFGTTKEHMAMVAIKNHKNGILDPYSHFKNEVTLDEVLKSPPVVSPLNLLDCCPTTDGAAVAIICRADLAGKYTDKPVYVAGFGMGTDYPSMHDKESFTGFIATTRAAKQAYAMAGISPRDIDVAEVHDCFTITEIMDYEDLGFCDKGQGPRLLEKGETDLRGRIPVNPSGGLLSKGHPLGATGVAQIGELYWHLREEAGERQVSIKKGYALQHNVGGAGVSNSVVTILTNKH
ncbi:MAG: thiolase domain-containing protein [Carboxydocellales bacterium]